MAFNGKTVLLAWELGEGLGHLPALKALAGAMAREGATPVFALREPVHARPHLAPTGGRVMPAPFWPSPRLPAAPSGSHADILAANGYGAPASALDMIGAWDAVIDLVKPDLVVCEHAPGAALSAHGRIPVAFVGNGLVVPPCAGDMFEPFEAGRGDPSRQVPVFDAIASALQDLGRTPPPSLTAPFRGVFRGIYTFPAIDTYRHARREALLGPVEPMPAATPLPAQRHLFAYSAADIAMIEPLTRALMENGPAASVYLRGLPGARLAVLRSRGIRVHERAPLLAEVLPTASAVFSHGGTGFTHAALACGRPQIVYPRHFEARSTARGLEALGCGICIDPFDIGAFHAAVRRVHDDAAMRDAAQAAAADSYAFMARAQAIETSLGSLRAALA